MYRYNKLLCASMESAWIEECIAFSTAKFGISTLKKEQDQAIRAFVEGSDVLTSLRTQSQLAKELLLLFTEYLTLWACIVTS